MRGKFWGSPLPFRQLKAIFSGDTCGKCGCPRNCHELRINEVHCKQCKRGCDVVFGAGEFHATLTEWLTRAAATVLLLALVACAPPPGAEEGDLVLSSSEADRLYEPRPERIFLSQHADIDLAWKMIGGAGRPPRVKFVYGAALDCPEGGGRFVKPGLSGCWGGYFTPGATPADDVVEVTIPETWWRLPHELLHAKKFGDSGRKDCDPTHGGLSGEAVRGWERPVLDPAEQMLLERRWL